MHPSQLVFRTLRPYYNLPSKSSHGRRLTGFLTPYRFWMWRQNELWRNIHEAQFEHLRRIYKRQWLESFRVNADEYIFKYNITKAAQLAEWERDMHAQEAKRVEARHTAQSRQILKQKHLDLLREHHEREFFYWYERTSERLQYMTGINYVKRQDIHNHIEGQLDKYVADKNEPYPLNFAGQMPFLEDSNCSITKVPSNQMERHVSEHPGTMATVYQPPKDIKRFEEQLEMLASSHEEGLPWLEEKDSDAFAQTIDEIYDEEEKQDDEKSVASSMEKSSTEQAIERLSYIHRGDVGSRKVFSSYPATDSSTERLDSTKEGERSSSVSKSKKSGRRNSKGEITFLTNSATKSDNSKVFPTDEKLTVRKAKEQLDLHSIMKQSQKFGIDGNSDQRRIKARSFLDKRLSSRSTSQNSSTQKDS